MKTGDIVFVRGHDLISRAIEWFDHGQFSHVALAVSSDHIIEAQYGTRARIVPMKYKDIEIVSLNPTPDQQKEIVLSAMKHVGELYDLKAIFWFVMTGQLSPMRPNHAVCSELVTQILTDVGMWSGSERIAPNELYWKVKNNDLRGVL